MMRLIYCLTTLAFVFSWGIATAEEITCDGTYNGHLQGIATDGENFIYWSFTSHLVKTDMAGQLIKEVTVPSHTGDLTYHDGKVYTAVELGEFNTKRKTGHPNAWVYSYDAEDLQFISKHEVPELRFGSGGMAYCEGRFLLVGGLPEDINENYVFEYDRDFHLIEPHIIASGHTRLGVQTVCYAEGHWWFGCYGKDLLVTDRAFNLQGKYKADFGYGIAALPNNRFLRGQSGKLPDTTKWWGKAEIISMDYQNIPYEKVK